VAVSHAEVRQLRALGVAESAIAHIANPIDDGECSRPADPRAFRRQLPFADAPIVLFLGKLTPRKGVGDLVRAFARLGPSRAGLVIAGNDMGARQSVERLVRQLGLRERVMFTGLLSGSARLDALAAASVVVYPSRDEIFGLVPLESLLCGTPVVVCNDSGCGEVISSTGGGQTVSYADVGDLARAIEAVLADEQSWRSRARAAAVVVRRRFAADVICGQLESLYRSIVDPTSAPCRIGA
jgi:glycosyltransferase involved in cell wall biosynthesis